MRDHLLFMHKENEHETVLESGLWLSNTVLPWATHHNHATAYLQAFYLVFILIS